MKGLSTREAAKRLGISFTSMNRYIAENKIPVPPLIEIGSTSARLWTDDDVEKVRVVLPKIANGRKTRHVRKKKQPKKK
jgi:predicted DNA-binding transcriptional regulator AlpA